MKSFVLYKNSYKLPIDLDVFSKYFNLCKGKKSNSGRGNLGHINVYNKGGCHKRNYRVINKKKKNFRSRLVSVEYDPNRSSFIGLFFDLSDSVLYFDLVCDSQQIGKVYYQGMSPEDAVIGNKMYLRDVPLGMLISSLEYKVGKGSQYLRSAGVFGKLQQKKILFIIWPVLKCLQKKKFISH